MRELKFKSAILEPLLPRLSGCLGWQLDCHPLWATEGRVHVIVMLVSRDATPDQLKRVDYLLGFDFIVKVNRSRIGQTKSKRGALWKPAAAG